MTLYAYRDAADTLIVADDLGHAINCASIEEMDRTIDDLHGETLPAKTVLGWRPDGRSARRP